MREVAKGDAVIFIRTVFPGWPVFGRVRSVTRRKLIVETRSGQCLEVTWDRVVEIIRVDEERADSIMAEYTRAYSEYESAYRRWAEQRQKDIADFIAAWDAQNRCPAPPSLKKIVDNVG